MSPTAGRPPWQGRRFHKRSKSRKANYTLPDAAIPQFRRHGAEAAETEADLNFRRRVELLCRHPGLVADLLSELAAERSIRLEVEGKLERYCSILLATLASPGAGSLCPTRIRAPLKLLLQRPDKSANGLDFIL